MLDAREWKRHREYVRVEMTPREVRLRKIDSLEKAQPKRRRLFASLSVFVVIAFVFLGCFALNLYSGAAASGADPVVQAAVSSSMNAAADYLFIAVLPIALVMMASQMSILSGIRRDINRH